jgi:hypothetical protein
MSQSYALAALIAIGALLAVTAESWYPLFRDIWAMLLVYAFVAGLAALGLWWLGWV